MCKLSVALTAIAVLFDGLFCANSQAQQPSGVNASRASVTAPRPVDGFALSVSPATPGTEHQITILITVTLANTTLHPKLEAAEMPARNFLFDVMDSKGEEMPLTRLGRHLKGNTSGIPWPRDGGSQQGDRANFTIPISELYDMSVPDTYKVVVKREFSTDHAASTSYVISNPITITVPVDSITWA